MEKVESFEDLWIWQEARALVRDIYTEFGKDTPAERDYGFRGQIQTAGVSIMNNIAEGFERTTDADKARFFDIAKGSAGEVRSMHYVAEDVGNMPGDGGGESLPRSLAWSQVQVQVKKRFIACTCYL